MRPPVSGCLLSSMLRTQPWSQKCVVTHPAHTCHGDMCTHERSRSPVSPYKVSQDQRNSEPHKRQNSGMISTPLRIPLQPTVGFDFSGHENFQADHQKPGERKVARSQRGRKQRPEGEVAVRRVHECHRELPVQEGEALMSARSAGRLRGSVVPRLRLSAPAPNKALCAFLQRS